jgi:hypothetical protein
VKQADGDDGQQAEDEKHGWKEKRPGRFSKSAQIHEGNEGEESEAERNGGRSQAWKSRRQCADSGCDGDGNGECVVDDQRCAGDKAGPGAKVGTGYRIRATPSRIGIDDLSVGEDQDRQQDNDGYGDRQDNVKSTTSRHSQHDDDRFGAIRHRGQSVER